MNWRPRSRKGKPSGFTASTDDADLSIVHTDQGEWYFVVETRHDGFAHTVEEAQEAAVELWQRLSAIQSPLHEGDVDEGSE